MADQSHLNGVYGVLLYYKYALIPSLDRLYDFYHSNCSSLHLLGRVRLSPHGVNVTVGGKLSALEEHIAALKSDSLFDGTDFKLASCHQPLDERVAKECGFTSLSIRIVKELVTFRSHPLLKSPEISNAGKHLSAVEFHSVLQNAVEPLDNGTSGSCKRVILLDARNLYETRIGKFHSSQVETLDPQIRQYSDLPSWIDDNSERLRGNHVLMYCTGGIRCEMASAYIRSKGSGFENVFQLFGGIQRYLEQFPDGGFFKGKNFVFDHRVSVGSSDSNILGKCLLCSSSYDDYSSRTRCNHCRMLVLVCGSCHKKHSIYVCELCQKNGKLVSTLPGIQSDIAVDLPKSLDLETLSTSGQSEDLPLLVQGNGTKLSRKLRILCLHGFRQNASSFRGRTSSLAKKLKNVAELIYIDAPHELPFIYQPRFQNSNLSCSSSLVQESPSPPNSCNKKFAWLVARDFKKEDDSDWKIAYVPFDSLQYQQQTEGLDMSLRYLNNVFCQAGPFDGILGFSQGAAMAALVCSLQTELRGDIGFKFVILCSGFAVNLEDHKRESIRCPSLHIFGNDKGNDRQIATNASRKLASLFDASCSLIIEHDLGHIIPTRSPYIDEIKNFLKAFI